MTHNNSGACRTVFSTVTEMPGTAVSQEQIRRVVNRYSFAALFCRDKDVLELACGPGLGLGILQRAARTLVAGDIDEHILDYARQTYGASIEIRCLDAQNLPFDDNSFDVVILFEAIYYLPQPERFVLEARRVLRKEGIVIICNPNKDLPDFNPSPFSHSYYNPPDFVRLFEHAGFEVECWGDSRVEATSLGSGVLSALKRCASRLNLIPRTMKGKVFLKRLVFGPLVSMPADLSCVDLEPENLIPLGRENPDWGHRVIFAVGTKGL